MKWDYIPDMRSRKTNMIFWWIIHEDWKEIQEWIQGISLEK